ncbi:hypothetical protein GCM10008967_29810 [Bacillus carboniphilus]|uniref:Uncharacterized protein n=1 Tax=Bacillus carboniphilus TaxID=86663 RepID=A0ABP3GAE3_9BACI
MNRPHQLTGKHSYKVGEAVTGIRAVIPTKNGREESGVVVYKRKAEYKDDPYKKTARA